MTFYGFVHTSRKNFVFTYLTAIKEVESVSSPWTSMFISHYFYQPVQTRTWKPSQALTTRILIGPGRFLRDSYWLLVGSYWFCRIMFYNLSWLRLRNTILTIVLSLLTVCSNRLSSLTCVACLLNLLQLVRVLLYLVIPPGFFCFCFKNSDRKIMQSIRITSRPPTKKRKWNQLSHFWRTSTKVIPIEKLQNSHFLKMSQGFQRSSKWKTNSSAYLFL